MDVDTLAPAAGDGGLKRKREEEDVGVKDSLSKRAKAAEELAVALPTPVTALRQDLGPSTVRGTHP